MAGERFSGYPARSMELAADIIGLVTAALGLLAVIPSFAQRFRAGRRAIPQKNATC